MDSSDSHSRLEHDCLYGDIELPSELSIFIATREFQRMKRIKQLGGADYIFKDATHTRYQHSIGTAFLAKALVTRLVNLQRLGHSNHPPETRIDEQDIICVEIAALCHDLGHGPFSYVFQNKVLPSLKLECSKQRERSYKIFEAIWQKIIEKDHDKTGTVLRDEDLIFIKEMIEGTTCSSIPAYKGRSKPKWFLYEIMSNANSVVDVCKWDYIPRDCLGLGRQERINVLEQLNKLSFVKHKDDEYYSIGYNGESDSSNFLLMLHKEAYQSDRVHAVQHMISDALVLADPYLRLSQCFDKQRNLIVSQFCEIDDGILQKIKEANPEPESDLDKAKILVERLEKELYYVCVKETICNGSDTKHIIAQFSEIDKSLNNCSIKISILDYRQKRDTNVKIIQVFCNNPDDKEKVSKACCELQKKAADIFADTESINKMALKYLRECGEFVSCT